MQQHLFSLKATGEQGKPMCKFTSMIVKGFSPAATFTCRRITASANQILAQHATNQQFSIPSVTVFGNPADGPKSIRGSVFLAS